MTGPNFDWDTPPAPIIGVEVSWCLSIPIMFNVSSEHVLTHLISYHDMPPLNPLLTRGIFLLLVYFDALYFLAILYCSYFFPSTVTHVSLYFDLSDVLIVGRTLNANRGIFLFNRCSMY